MISRESITQALFFVLLMNLLLMGYQYFFAGSEDMSVLQPLPPAALVKGPTLGKGRHIKVETDTMTLWIDTIGGRISKAIIAGEKDPFFNTDKDGYLDAQSGYTGDAKLAFSSDKNSYVMDGNGLTVTLSATDSTGVTYQKRFEFQKGEPVVKVKSIVANHSGKPITVQNYNVIGGDKVSEKGTRSPSPKNLSFEGEQNSAIAVKNYSGISYTTQKKSYVRMKFNKMQKSKPEKTKGGWIAFQKRHFIAAWVFEPQSTYSIRNFWNEGLSSEDADTYEQQFVTQAVSKAETLAPGKQTSQVTRLYLGEQSIPKMMAVEPSLRLTLDYGFFWMLSSWLHKVLRFVHDFIPSWSFSLMFLVLFIRAIMFPSMKQQALQAKKMKAMQPEKEIIESRYENDKWNPQRFEELSNLHKKYDINPMNVAMLVPLLQIPLMFAFFNMVQVAVEFRQESFLWISDMSQKDPYYILPVLASLMMMLHFSNQKDNGMSEEFKLVFRVMPLIMLFISIKWPAVICLYLIMNTLLFALQDKVFQRQS